MIDSIIEKILGRLFSPEDKIIINSERISHILTNLPNSGPSIRYPSLLEIFGTHEPCPNNILRKFTTKGTIMKSPDGSEGHICCVKPEHAKKMANIINNDYSNFEYSATHEKNRVDIKLSRYSTASLLAKKGYHAKYCSDCNGDEGVIIGASEGIKSGNIQNVFTEAKYEWKTDYPGTQTIYPDRVKTIAKNVWLPLHVQNYRPQFIKFLIDEKPNEKQFKTFETLYQLILYYPSALRLSSSNLSKIITTRTGLPKDTVRKHLGQEDLIQRLKPTIGKMLSVQADFILDVADEGY